MATLRVVSPSFAPAQRLDEPIPAFVADRTSLADSILHLVHDSSRGGGNQAENDGGEPPRRPERRRRVEDLLIRLGGLGAIALSAGAFTWLYHLVHATPVPHASLGQYLLAAIGFLGASSGSGLLLLGRHIHDRVELSERWRPRL